MMITMMVFHGLSGMVGVTVRLRVDGRMAHGACAHTSQRITLERQREAKQQHQEQSINTHSDRITGVKRFCHLY